MMSEKKKAAQIEIKSIQLALKKIEWTRRGCSFQGPAELGVPPLATLASAGAPA